MDICKSLLQLAVYTVIFSSIMRVDIDKFYMYLFVALVPWIFFFNIAPDKHW